MHSKSNNIEIMINDQADELIEGPFESILNRHRIGLETPMRGSDFIFDFVYLLYYKSHKIISQQGEPYIGSPDWIRNQNAIINLINKKDNKYFQYAVTFVLNHEEIKKDPQRITKYKPLINKHNWEEINYPSEKDD